METLEQKIRKNAVANGLIFGVIFLIITIFSFYFVTAMTTLMIALFIVPLLLTFLGALGAAILLIFNLRKKIGGFWNFRQATTGIFIMFIIGYAVNTAGSYAFRVLIEPDMVQKMETVFVNGTSDAMKKSGSSQEDIDKKVADVQSRFEDQKEMTAGKFAKGFAISVILDFVFALIFAAFFKREPLLSLDGEDSTVIDETV